MKEIISVTAKKALLESIESLIMLSNGYDLVKKKGEYPHSWLEKDEEGWGVPVNEMTFNQLVLYEWIEKVSYGYERVYRYQITENAERIMKHISLKCKRKMKLAETGVYLKSDEELTFNSTPIKRVFIEWTEERIHSPDLSILGFSSYAEGCLSLHGIQTIWDFKMKKLYQYLLKRDLIVLLEELAVYNPTVDSIEEFGCSDALYVRMKKMGIERIQDIPSRGYGKYLKPELLELVENFIDYDSFESTWVNKESA